SALGPPYVRRKRYYVCVVERLPWGFVCSPADTGAEGSLREGGGGSVDHGAGRDLAPGHGVLRGKRAGLRGNLRGKCARLRENRACRWRRGAANSGVADEAGFEQRR